MRTIPTGYDDTYAAWILRANGDQVAFTFAPSGAVSTTIAVRETCTSGCVYSGEED